MASILRASSELAFSPYEEWAIQYLQNVWSPDLADLSISRISYATESIFLAKRFGIGGVLKRAMYELVRREGFGQDEAEDGEGEGLSPTVMVALVRGREKLTSMWVLAAASPLKDFEHCTGVGPLATPTATPVAAGSTEAPAHADPKLTISPCTTLSPSLAIQVHTKLVHTSGIFEEFHADPLCGLEALMDAPWGEGGDDGGGFCEACVQKRRLVWGKKREKGWEHLGIWFGLGDQG